MLFFRDTSTRNRAAHLNGPASKISSVSTLLGVSEQNMEYIRGLCYAGSSRQFRRCDEDRGAKHTLCCSNLHQLRPCCFYEPLGAWTSGPFPTKTDSAARSAIKWPTPPIREKLFRQALASPRGKNSHTPSLRIGNEQ